MADEPGAGRSRSARRPTRESRTARALVPSVPTFKRNRSSRHTLQRLPVPKRGSRPHAGNGSSPIGTAPRLALRVAPCHLPQTELIACPCLTPGNTSRIHSLIWPPDQQVPRRPRLWPLWSPAYIFWGEGRGEAPLRRAPCGGRVWELPRASATPARIASVRSYLQDITMKPMT